MLDSCCTEENIIEYSFILCPGGYIKSEHLPESFGGHDAQAMPPSLLASEGMSLEEIEKNAIHHSLLRNKWKKMLTCRELAISKDTLRRKIEKYQLVNPLETAG